MEFKKIDDKKFQCLLFEEDLEENNISLDDFLEMIQKRYMDFLMLLWKRQEKRLV